MTVRAVKSAAAFILSFVLLFSLRVPVSAEEESCYDKETLLSFVYEADIPSLHRLLEEGYVTSSELCGFYLDRIDSYNDDYNCFVTLCDDVLSEAAEHDEVISAGEDFGLLYGIPVVIKDNIDVASCVSSNGVTKKKAEAETDSAVVSFLKKEGAVIIGKTNMSTEAQMSRYTVSLVSGETKNAYSTDLSSGGSSGGSAVAVSLDFASAALGTDTNSSLRYPAALNGCVALRPTFGLTDRDGVITLNSQRDVVGSITRTVTDQAIMLDCLTENEYSYFENLNADAIKGMKIGVLKELSSATANSPWSSSEIDGEIISAFSAAVEILEKCGAEVTEVSLSNLFSMSAACSEDRSEYKSAKEKYYGKFEALLEEENISAVIFPTYLSSPLSSGRDSDGNMKADNETYANTCSYLSPPLGIPEISVQIGNHSSGAGIGMEIASLKNEEQLLLDIAYAFSEASDFRTVPKNTPNLHENKDNITLEELFSPKDTGADAYVSSEDIEESEKTPETAEKSGNKFLLALTVIAAIVILLIIIVIIDFYIINRHKIKRRRNNGT